MMAFLIGLLASVLNVFAEFQSTNFPHDLYYVRRTKSAMTHEQVFQINVEFQENHQRKSIFNFNGEGAMTTLAARTIDKGNWPIPKRSAHIIFIVVGTFCRLVKRLAMRHGSVLMISTANELKLMKIIYRTLRTIFLRIF